MLNARPIALDATGLLKNIPVASVPLPRFNGGTPLSQLGELVTSATAPDVYNDGLGYTTAGALCIDTAGAIAKYAPGGMPLTAADRAAVSVAGVATRWLAGLPFDAGGRLALATASGFLNLHGFTTGFAQTGFQ